MEHDACGDGTVRWCYLLLLPPSGD